MDTSKQYPRIETMKENAWVGFYGQQYYLYAANDDVFFYGLDNEQKDTMTPELTLAEAQALVDRVQRSDYARMHWPRFYRAQRVVVDQDISKVNYPFQSRPYTGAFTDLDAYDRGGPLFIHLSPHGNWTLSSPVVLHELAHAIEVYEYGTEAMGRDDRGHGPHFAGRNIEVVREFLSPEKATELSNAFQYAGVKIS